MNPILILNSDENLLSLFSAKLDEDLKLKSINLKTIKEGMAFLKNKRPSLVITEFSFGADNASEVYLYIRDNIPEIPVLLVTAMSISGITGNPTFENFFEDNVTNHYLELNEAKTEIATVVADILSLETSSSSSSNQESLPTQKEKKLTVPAASEFNFSAGKNKKITNSDKFKQFLRGTVFLLEENNEKRENLTFFIQSLYHVGVISFKDYDEVIQKVKNGANGSKISGMLCQSLVGNKGINYLINGLIELKDFPSLMFFAENFPDDCLDFKFLMENTSNVDFIATPFNIQKLINGLQGSFELSKVSSERISDEKLGEIDLMPLFPTGVNYIREKISDKEIIFYEKMNHEILQIEESKIEEKLNDKNLEGEFLYIERKNFVSIIQYIFKQ